MYIRFMEEASNQRLIPFDKFGYQPFGRDRADDSFVQHSLNRQACRLIVQFSLDALVHVSSSSL